MKTMIRKYKYYVILAMALLIPASVLFVNIEDANAATVVDSGPGAGNNTTWQLDDEGTLSINGIGRLSDLLGISGSEIRERTKTIEIGDGITEIRQSAFSCFSNVTSVKIPSSVTKIGSFAFKLCDSLTDITIPEGVTVLSEYAFDSCKNLEKITLPNSLTKIGASAFIRCDNLLKFYINDIEKYLEIEFGGGYYSPLGKYRELYVQGKLATSISIPYGVTRLGKHLCGCQSLVEVIIPKSVTSIETSAFTNCRSLKNISIPESVAAIGNAAFSNCISLKSISIPRSVAVIGPGTFANCESLESITIPEGVTSISGFANCKNLTSIVIPKSATSIGEYAFQECSSIREIVIPNGVESIGDMAFVRCNNLTEITIPDSVVSIGECAFQECSSLKDIFYEGTSDQWEKLGVQLQIRGLNKVTVHYEANGHKSHTWNTECTIDKEATCTEDGSKSIHCSICDVIDESTVTVIPKGHVWNKEYTVDKKATCTEDGSKSIHCSVCDAIDESTSTSIPATGHDWNNPTYEWTKDNSLVTATHACKNSANHQETEKAATTAEIAKKPTYTAMGQTAYTATFTNPEFTTQTKVVTNIPKLPKKVNPMTVKAKTKTLKYSALKKKTQTIKRTKVLTVSKAKGNVTYRKKNGNRKILINKYTGNITVKKGLKRGTYRVKIKVNAAGNQNYKPLTKAVTFKIIVK